jgi:hypothetical protein
MRPESQLDIFITGNKVPSTQRVAGRLIADYMMRGVSC